MIQKFNNFFNKIPMTGLNNLRIDMERKFISSYHKIEMQGLKTNLEEDKWIPSDILFEYYDIISYLIGEEITNRKSDVDETKFEDVLSTERLINDSTLTSIKAKPEEN